MSDSISSQLSQRMHMIDDQLLTALRSLSDQELKWSDRPSAPSIAFHIWHISRYADRNQAQLGSLVGSGSAQEIWQSEQIAQRWGMDASVIGREGTGIGLSDEDSAQLTLPAKADLLDYAERAFGLLDQRYASMTDEVLASDMSDASGSQTNVGAALLSHLTHASRHLGMVEALRGMQGQRGTASA